MKRKVGESHVTSFGPLPCVPARTGQNDLFSGLVKEGKKRPQLPFAWKGPRVFLLEADGRPKKSRIWRRTLSKEEKDYKGRGGGAVGWGSCTRKMSL